jgi:NAD(P)H-dependent FMN reductase
MTRPAITAISGSLRTSSYTRVSLAYALEAAERKGSTTELIDLREYELPPINPDDEEPADATRLTATVREADAVLLGTPVYHGSYSAPLKNALDYCGFDEFEDTTVGLLAVAGGAFPISALDHLRTVCRAVNAWVLPHQAAIPNVYNQVEDGNITDETIAERVETLGERAVEFARIEPDPQCFESEHNIWPTA